MNSHFNAFFLISDFNATCIDLNISDNCMLLTGYMALYKVCVPNQRSYSCPPSNKVNLNFAQIDTGLSVKLFSQCLQYESWAIFNFCSNWHFPGRIKVLY